MASLKEQRKERNIFISVGGDIVQELIVMPGSALPLIFITDEMVDRFKIASHTTPNQTTINFTLVSKNEDNTIDNERFVYIGNCVSNVTKLKYQFFYDKEYSDIMLIPDLSPYVEFPVNAPTVINNVYIISLTDISNSNSISAITDKLTIDNNKGGIVDVPSTLTGKHYTVAFPGCLPGNVDRNNRIFSKIDDDVSFWYGESSPTTIIELGTVSALLKNSQYMLRPFLTTQADHKRLRLHKIPTGDYGTKKLYVHLAF